MPASAVGQDNQGYFVYLIEEKETVLGVQKLLVRTSITIAVSYTHLKCT